MKIFIQCIAGFISSIIFGIIGLIIGAMIGGNFGFIGFGGNVGYEAGGVFFAIVGICLGSLLGMALAKKLLHMPQYWLWNIIITIASAIIGILLFDYKMSGITGLIILSLPTTGIVIASNLKTN